MLPWSPSAAHLRPAGILLCLIDQCMSKVMYREILTANIEYSAQTSSVILYARPAGDDYRSGTSVLSASCSCPIVREQFLHSIC